MGFLTEKCINTVLTREIISSAKTFTCGNADLDEFFRRDALLYANQRLGKTYCYVLENDPSTIVCLYTLSNSSIRADLLPSSRKAKLIKNVPFPKRMRRYPSVLIGRLGVAKQFQHTGVSDELMDIIKMQVTDEDYLTCARYIVVDSYNEDGPRKYYNRNGFKDLFSSEEQEAENIHAETPLLTRFMFFDLMNIE